MKRWLSIALLLLAAPLVHAKGAGGYLDVQDFHCGVDNYHSSLTIPDCYVQDGLNVYFDRDVGVDKRKGFVTVFTTSPYSFSGEWSYTDTSNNIWMIVRGSDTIMATTGIGNTTFNIKVATVAASNIVSEVSAFGTAYFVDQTQGVFYWNGTSTTYVSGSPKGSLIQEFHGRIWVSGLASPNGNQVYGSKYLDGTTWTTGSLATDAVVLNVGLADNSDVVTCMHSGFNDSLYVMQNTHISSVIGYDSTNFQVNAIGREVGCINQGSVQQYLGGLVFASLRGFEFFDGYTATRISDPIKNKVDPITLNSTFNQNSWTQSTQADWQAGTIGSPAGSLSATIAAPALVLTTSVVQSIDTNSADFNSGTYSNTFASANSVVLSTNSNEVLNNSFETGSIDNWTMTNSGGATASKSATTAQSGTYSMLCNAPGDGATSSSWQGGAGLSLLDVNGSTLEGGVCTPGGSSGWYQMSCTVTNRVRQRIKIKLLLSKKTCTGGVCSSAQQCTITSDSFIDDGATTLTFYQNIDDIHNAYLDLVAGSPRSTIVSGTFTSRAFDSTFPTTVAKLVSANLTSNTPTPTIGLQHSSDNLVWVDLGQTIGTAYTSNRYIRYLSTFTFGATDNAQSSIDDVTVSVSSTTTFGTFTSPSHNISTATSFGNLSITDSLNGGNITFAVCTANNSNMTSKTCSATTANGQIAVSTNIFVQVIATFTVVSTTNTPTLNSVAVNWYTGTRKPPMTSMVYDNRYWVSVATDTASTYNDTTLVLSKGPLWTIFDVKAGAFTLWKNAPYFADAAPTGKVYLLDQGYNDAGAAINAYIKTKDYSPGGMVSDKFFDTFYVVADNLGSGSIYSSYYIDRSTNTFSFGNIAQNETPGTLITSLRFPFDSGHMVFGKTISFKIQQNDVDVPMKLYGGAARYRIRPTQ